MTLDEFQAQAVSTGGLSYRERSVPAVMGCALAVAGEAGEVVDLVKKWAMQGKPLDRARFVEELGDCLWGLALLAKSVGVTLEEVGRENGRKLRARYPEGPRAVPAPVIPEWVNPEIREALEGGAAPDGLFDSGNGYVGRCNHRSSRGWWCTRVPGHNGEHIAASESGVCERWPWDAAPGFDANGSPVDAVLPCPICDCAPCQCEALGYRPGFD